MNEIRVASSAFAAYLHISALAQSITMIGAPRARERRVEVRHQLRRPRILGADHHPIGLHEVLDGRPCFRNSGLLTTLNGCVVSRRMTSRTFSAVPTGTVLLSTITL